MPQLVRRTAETVVRPLKILIPLIQGELEHAESAGLEHYRLAGAMLNEAKSQMPWGNWSKWLSKNFALSQSTAGRYMRYATRMDTDPEFRAQAPHSGDLRVLLGERARTERVETHASWRPVAKAARELDAELFAQERQAQADEVQIHRDLALELINLGYRAMATRLHPDRGGSKDAMVRLNRVREHLTTVAKQRRFV